MTDQIDTTRNAAIEAELLASLSEYGIPQHMHGGVVRYIIQRLPPGDFMYALLTNDLMEAFGRADEANIAAMFWWVKFIYNELPSPCWGSPEKVEAWLAGDKC